MFSLIVSSDPTAWETDQLMRMLAERFNTYSGAEAAAISLERPTTLQALDGTKGILMYETGTAGPTADFVRYGIVRTVKPAGNYVTFRFTEEGRFTRDIIREFGQRLGINERMEYGHTHWAIKDGALPTAMLAMLNHTTSVSGNEQLIVRVESFKNMLVSHATGGGCDASHYTNLRRELLDIPRVSAKLPRFVRTCRSPGEFWGFIKPKFSTYHQRREFIREEFETVLSMLESESRSPNDGNVSAALQRVTSDYVHETWTKALDRRSTDPEGAITIARTLLESVCKHILDETGTAYKDTEDLPKLYSQVASQLNLSPSQHAEQVFKQILGSCQSVVEGLGALRNRLSDAHGKGKTGARPAPRHAELAVNLAGTMATFLLETQEARKGQSK